MYIVYNLHMKKEIQRVALRDLVHQQLLERILHGDLPAGSRVKDTDLSESMNVSRTPVREALLGLVKEGFLENQVGRGFIVHPLTEQEVKDIYPIIRALETLALQSSEPLPRDIHKDFESILAEMEAVQSDFIRLIQLDSQWHNTLLSGCHNQRLTGMIADLKALAFRYEYEFMEHREQVMTSINEHRDIADALLNKGTEAAVPLLEKHWESSRLALLNYIKGE